MFLRRSNAYCLTLIWVIFLVKGAFYSFLFPLWEGFDEFSHFEFVQHLALHHELPGPETHGSRQVQESLTEAPLPWALRDWPSPYATHDAYWRLDAAERQRREQQLRAIRLSVPAETGTDIIYEEKQAPLYYSILVPAFFVLRRVAMVKAVYLLRLVSVLIVSSIVPIAFASGRYISGSSAFGLQAAAFITAMPELFIDVSRVGNESLAIVMMALFVYSAMRTIDDERFLPLLALLLGLGLLTKAYFVTVAPVFAALALRTARARRDSSALRSIGSFALVVVVCGWWYYRNASGNSGMWIDVSPSQSMNVKQVLKSIWLVDWPTAIRSVSLSHIWVGGWSFLQVRSWIYEFFEGLGILAFVGFLFALSGYGRSRTRIQNEHLGVIAVTYFCFVLGITYNAAVNFLNAHLSSSPGWYLYAVVLAEALLAMAGLSSLLPGRFSRFAAPACIGCFALLELYTVHFVLIPYYTGFVAHTPTGSLRAFHVTQLLNGGFSTMLGRLVANKPEFMTQPAFAILWLLFILSTISLVPVSARKTQ